MGFTSRIDGAKIGACTYILNIKTTYALTGEMVTILPRIMINLPTLNTYPRRIPDWIASPQARPLILGKASI